MSLAAPVKRKRGRPRKNPLPDGGAGAVSGTAIAIARLHAVHGPAGEGAPAPEHARPGLAIGLGDGLEVIGGPAAGPVTKRKRGRPRKNPLPDTGVSAGPVGLLALEPVTGTGVVGQAVAPVKRGRGRPRKNPPAGASGPVATETRPVPGLAVPGQGPGTFAEPVKRKRGRPRKQPAAGPVGPAPAVPGAPVPLKEVQGDGNAPAVPKADEPEKCGVAVSGTETGTGAGTENATGTVLVDRFGIGPGNSEGIGFWPPKPEQIESVKSAAASAGVVSDRRRGRRPKTEDSTGNAPAPPIARSAFGADVEGKPFCGKCGTYTRVIQPEKGPPKRACPKCHPEKIPLRRSPLDKTGMPCKDRGVCRPERCVIAFDCEEMRKSR